MTDTHRLQRLDVGPRYSEAALFNNVVYLGGMVPERGDTDIRGQTDDVLQQVQARLEQAGSDKSRLLQVQIFLADIQDITAMNAVWDTWVVPGHAPPRATVQAALAHPGYRIEVVATAAVGPALPAKETQS